MSDLISLRHQRQVQQRLGASGVRGQQLDDGLQAEEAERAGLDGNRQLDRVDSNLRCEFGACKGEIRIVGAAVAGLLRVCSSRRDCGALLLGVAVTAVMLAVSRALALEQIQSRRRNGHAEWNRVTVTAGRGRGRGTAKGSAGSGRLADGDCASGTDRGRLRQTIGLLQGSRRGAVDFSSKHASGV